MQDRILIDKNLIPYSFDIALPDELYTIGITYNSTADLFTVSLSKDNEVICAGEPIIYGVPLFRDIAISEKFPNLKITPIDESGEHNTVTYDNFGETVFLVVNWQIKVILI